MSELNPAFSTSPRVAVADIGRGFTWFTDAFSLFMRAPLHWLLVGIAFIVSFTIMAFIPMIGQLLMFLAMSFFMAGIGASARLVDAGSEFRTETMVAPLTNKAEKLLILGAIYTGFHLLIVAILVVITLVLVGATIGAAVLSGDVARLATSIGVLLSLTITALIALGLYLPLTMAMWFAPMLVYFHDVEPIAAMKMSFRACLRNSLPFLLYGLLGLAAMAIVGLPVILGYLPWIPFLLLLVPILLLLLPILLLTVYSSYKDCITTD